MKRNWVYFILFNASWITIIFIYGYIKKKDIKQNSVFTYGRINYYGRTSRGAIIINYEYYVKGEKYEAGGGSKYFDDCEKTGWCIGKCFEVQYSSKHPDNSTMNFDKPCDCPKELDTTKTGQY